MSYYEHGITSAEAFEYGEQKVKQLICSRGASLELVKSTRYLLVETDRREPVVLCPSGNYMSGGELIKIMLGPGILARICRKIELEILIHQLEELQRKRRETALRRRRA